MRLSAGDKLGPYEVVSPLGEGGMGEVWKARDTRLDRTVALKISKEEFSERFEREARAVAALNHPYICQLYDVGPNYLVMEYIEGTPLVSSTKSAAMPLDQALKLGAQICEALAAAHAQGITHRDLKPANILVTKTGIKLLDFGLAKAAPPVAPMDGATLTMALTGKNEIIGTLNYMSPEQLQADSHPIDARSDIFAFGLVLYEMLTGKRAINGPSAASVIAAILERPAPSVASVAPQALDRALQKCLAKNPEERWQTARDLGDELRWIAGTPATVSGPAPEIHPPSRIPWYIAAACAAAALVLAVAWLRKDPSHSTPVRFSLPDREDFQFSPDGRYLLRSGRSLELREASQLDWRSFPGTGGAQQVFWAEDSSAIAFFADGRLKLLSLDGKSSVRSVADAPHPLGGSWRGGVNGTILFASERKLHIVDLASGSVRDFPISLQPGESVFQPVFLPEGDGFVFLKTAGEGRDLFRANLGAPGAPPQRLLDSGYRVAFARHPRTGGWYMFYNSTGRTVVAAPINPKTGVPASAPVKILEDLNIRSGIRWMNFSVANNGAITWSKARASLPIWRLRWYDRAGASLGTIGDFGTQLSLALSPDETRAAVIQGYPEKEVWVYNLQRNTSVRLSHGDRIGDTVLWSADSRSVYYADGSGGSWAVVRQAIDSSVSEILVHGPPEASLLSLEDITPDGKSIILLIRDATGVNTVLYRADLARAGENGTLEKLLLDFPYSRIGGFARLTPDGHWLLFSGDAMESAYIVPYPPGAATPRLVSRTFSSFPFFSRDGRQLFGYSQDLPTGLTVQPVLTGPDGLHLGERSPLFSLRAPTRASANVGAATRDGRILAIAGDASEELNSLVLTDWTALMSSEGN